MTDRSTIDRRTVLRTMGAGTTAGVGLSSIAGASEATRGSPDNCGPLPKVPPEAANRPDTYVSTVDRVVDGEHVVILLEKDNRTVDQIVVPSETYPCLEERDRLVVTVDGDELENVWRLRESRRSRSRRHGRRIDQR